MKMTQCLSIDLNQQERQKSQERPMDIWKLLGDGNGIPNHKKKNYFATGIRICCLLYGRKKKIAISSHK